MSTENVLLFLYLRLDLKSYERQIQFHELGLYGRIISSRAYI